MRALRQLSDLFAVAILNNEVMAPDRRSHLPKTATTYPYTNTEGADSTTVHATLSITTPHGTGSESSARSISKGANAITVDIGTSVNNQLLDAPPATSHLFPVY